MTAVFFFYGLAFILMGILIFLMPKKKDLLHLADSLWLIGLFGLIRGSNEWIDLFLLLGKPFDRGILSTMSSLLLPASFLCLVLFATRILSRERPEFGWVRHLWLACLALWIAAYFFGKGFLIAGIAARYFICFPGALLSAYVLAQPFFKPRGESLPRLMTVTLGILAATFAAYGILAGLIVPKAGFLPASILNYSAFIKITGLPVQFFRMLCALVMALAFAVVVAFYASEEGRLKFRGGIRAKVSAAVCVAVLLTACTVTGLSYWQGFKLLHDAVVVERKEAAVILGAMISNFLDQKINDVKTATHGLDFRESIQRTNSKYGGLTEPEILREMESKDKVWMAAPDDSPLIRDTVDGPLGSGLKKTVQYEEDIAELFCTDQSGGLVAASNRTSDFYQADETWWVRGFNHGAGAVFIDKAAYDESSQTMALPLAVPIKDESGRVIGVCKAVVNIESFLDPVRRFAVGKTGHVEIMDQDGRNIFHPGRDILSFKLFLKDDFLKILESKEFWFIGNPVHETGRKVIVWSEIQDPRFNDSGQRWFVIIDQAYDEMFDPLKVFVFQALGILVLLIGVMIVLGFYLGGRLVGPLRELQEAAKSIAGGALDHQIELKTGDEIESLADAFNQMTVDLKRTLISRDDLLKEVVRRQGAEKEALLAKKDWEDSFNAISDMVTIHDMDFNILRANQAAEGSLGISLREILNQKCFKSYHGTECSPAGCPSCSVLKTGVAATTELFEPHLDKFVEITALPRFDQDRRLIGLVHIVRDITARKKAEEAVHQSEEKYRSLYESSQDAIMTLEPPSWAFTAGNPATVQMFGAKNEAEFVGQTPYGLSPGYQPDGKPSMEKSLVMIHTALKNGSHFFEWTHKRITGEEFPATVLLTRVQLGQREFLQATVRDISEHKKAEEKINQALNAEIKSREIMSSMLEDNNQIRVELEKNLEELKKTQNQLIQVQKMEAVGKLAGGIAHDFNNLLTVISGYLELLLENGEARKSFGVELQEIKNAADRAKNLVKQLLAFGRREIIAPKVFDPNVLLWDLEKMLRRLVPENVEIIIKYADRIGKVKADPNQIEQVLINLVVNARDAMPGGGRIMVETHDINLDDFYADRYANIHPGDYVMISVSDTGGGMTEDVKQHIFEPFFTTKPRSQGTGLGLATSYGIVHQHGGHITVYSEVGHGTVIKIYLPHAEGTADRLVSQRKDETLPTGTETLLVVEDEPSLRRMTVSMLERLGYKILEAQNGQEALEVFHQKGPESFHLVLTDVIMPVMGGRELINAITREKKDVKVIFTSGYTDDATLRQGVVAGAVQFLQKPFTRRALAFKIREMLDGK